jgi:hypothetical protein
MMILDDGDGAWLHGPDRRVPKSVVACIFKQSFVKKDARLRNHIPFVVGHEVHYRSNQNVRLQLEHNLWLPNLLSEFRYARSSRLGLLQSVILAL